VEDRGTEVISTFCSSVTRVPAKVRFYRSENLFSSDVFGLSHPQYVHKIAPRGVYTSGKGSSAVGLTAYVTRDPDSKQLVLERSFDSNLTIHVANVI